jgi:acetyl esterase/lipase
MGEWTVVTPLPGGGAFQRAHFALQMLDVAPKYSGSKEKRFIMGGSAGGNLAAAVALKYASNPATRPSGLIVACLQSCDVKALPTEYKKRFAPEKYTDSPMINRELMLQATGKRRIAGYIY